MNYDLVAGVDYATLDTLALQAYGRLYPKLFKTVFTIGKYGLKCVDVDINAAPVFGAADDAVKAMLRETLAARDCSLSEADREAFLEGIAPATLSVSLPSVALSVEFSGSAAPVTVKASLSACASIATRVTEEKNSITLQIVTGKISLPEMPAVETILNEAVVPEFLIPYLNEKVLTPFAVDPLQFAGMEISLPVPCAGKNLVTAAAALGHAQPDVPAPLSGWPAGSLFVGVDTAVLHAAAGKVFPLGPADSFKWGGGGYSFSGRVAAQVLSPDPIVINGDGSITGTITVQALAQLTVEIFGIPVSFGPRATAGMSVKFRPSVQGSTVFLCAENIPTISFTYDWGLPNYLTWLVNLIGAGLTAALNAVIGPLVAQALGQAKIPVCNLPAIEYTYEGTKLTLRIDSATTATCNGLLAVAAQARIV
jgi:hypothetical protein